MARSTSPTSTTTTPTPGAKALQERLHQLLTRLSSTMDLIKNWPTNNNDNKKQGENNETTFHSHKANQMIASILQAIAALKQVESVVKSDPALRKTLQDCQVPINLLDLMDHGNGLNPDCFSRGLLREAIGQLAGLKRRKLALEMLGAAVQRGLQQRTVALGDDDESPPTAAATTTTTTTTTTTSTISSGTKRPRTNEEQTSATKRLKLQPEETTTTPSNTTTTTTAADS